MNPIEISHITKDYGSQKGVFDVTFQVREGEIMGFLGPNGAGKTTTIRQLCGFLRPDSGHLRILGMDCFSRASEIAEHFGYLPGEIAFLDSMRADEFIRFVARMKGLKDCGRAAELSERFAFDPRSKIRRMSKGMKQKLGIICAFLHDPKILILDEPTSGLDPVMQKVFVELLLEEKKREKTILMSSHIFEEFEKTCDRAAVIRNGRLLSVDRISSLKSARQKTLCLTLETPQMAQGLAAQLKELPGTACSGMVCSVTGSHVELTVLGSIDAYLKLFARYTVLDMDIRTPSLEEWFLHYYDEKQEAAI